MKKILNSILSILAGSVYWLLSRTWRYQAFIEEGPNPPLFTKEKLTSSIIFGHWHGDELALIGFCRCVKFLTLASQSDDGQIMASALKVLGFKVLRGSSSRGGAKALLSLLREISHSNYYLSMAMDGPRGPRHEAKPGIAILNEKSKASCFQCLVDCNSFWSIPNTWNKTYVPKAFAKISLYFYFVPKEISREDLLVMMNKRTEIDGNQRFIPIELN